MFSPMRTAKHAVLSKDWTKMTKPREIETLKFRQLEHNEQADVSKNILAKIIVTRWERAPTISGNTLSKEMRH